MQYIYPINMLKEQGKQELLLTFWLMILLCSPEITLPIYICYWPDIKIAPFAASWLSGSDM